MRAALLTALAMGALLCVNAASAETLRFTAKLNGASETPPNATKGAGTAAVTLNTDTKTLTWKIRYSGLSGPATMAHFHGPAAPGVAAGVTVGLTDPLASPISGSAALNDGQIGDLRAGLWYLNIHTAQIPKGEIRGQVLAAH